MHIRKGTPARRRGGSRTYGSGYSPRGSGHLTKMCAGGVSRASTYRLVLRVVEVPLRSVNYDGLGSMLGSLTLKLDVAGELLERDPLAARALLSELKTQAQSAVVDVRRLVYALRPPALDDLGLLGAIGETAAQYVTNGLHVSVDAPGQLPPLPAAVEVAYYRIAQEAMTNVVRHAEASECVVRLALDETVETLRLEIRDDGRGLAPGHGRGGSVASVRERAAELGGHCVVESLPAGGTLVRALLPCTTAARAVDARPPESEK
jgi:signal transduction histidine kinase